MQILKNNVNRELKVPSVNYKSILGFEILNVNLRCEYMVIVFRTYNSLQINFFFLQ